MEKLESGHVPEYIEQTRGELLSLGDNVARNFLNNILQKLNSGKNLQDEINNTPKQFVICVKILLKQKNIYTGPINNKIDSLYDLAIKRFQKKNGLRVDGILGINTLTVLLGSLNNKEKNTSNKLYTGVPEQYQQNSEKVFNYLKSIKVNGKNLDEVTIAAFWGNIWLESAQTFSPTIKQSSGGGGYGLCQRTDSDRKIPLLYGESKLILEKKYGDNRRKKAPKLLQTIESQVNYIKYELENTEKVARKKIQQVSGLRAKTEAIMKFYERPGVKAKELRVAAAANMPNFDNIAAAQNFPDQNLA